MVTLAMSAAMKGPMYSSRENGSLHGSHGFDFRLSTFQGSASTDLTFFIFYRYGQRTKENISALRVTKPAQ